MRTKKRPPKLYDLIRDTDEAKAHTERFTLWPKLWKDRFQRAQPVFSWQMYPFSPRSRGQIPESSGIYTFVVNPNVAQHCCSYLMYVGVTVDQTLRDRFSQYLREKDNPSGRPRIVWLLNHYDERHLFFCCSTFRDRGNLKRIEQKLIQAFVPPYNQQIDGLVGRIIRGIR